MSKPEPVPGMIAGNAGKPILLPEVHLDGVAAESVPAGGRGKFFTRLAISSGEAGFHTIAEGLGRLIVSYASAVGASFSLDRSGTIVLLIREDKSAELWVDTAAMSLNIIAKRPIKAGQAVFQSDIADIIGMNFPCLEIRDTDSLVVLFRKDWGFGLYFDFNPDKKLDREIASRQLGRLYRVLAYRHLYETLADAAVVERLIARGWFPFVETIGDEFRNLAEHCAAGFPMEDAEAALLAAFDDSRLDNLLERWRARPHFAAKMPLLEAALKHFRADEPIAAIKIAITEIEGVLRSAYANASYRSQRYVIFWISRSSPRSTNRELATRCFFPKPSLDTWTDIPSRNSTLPAVQPMRARGMQWVMALLTRLASPRPERFKCYSHWINWRSTHDLISDRPSPPMILLGKCLL